MRCIALVAALVAASCAASGTDQPATGATQAIDSVVPSTATPAVTVGESGSARVGDSDVDGGDWPGVVAPVGGSGFVFVELGFDFGCALRGSGHVACWGWNEFGQASPPPEPVSVLAVGYAFACGIGVDGSVVCWGDTARWAEAVPDGVFVDVSAGDGFACGVRLGGSVACWGRFRGDGVVSRRGVGFRDDRVGAGVRVCGPRRRFARVLVEGWNQRVLAGGGDRPFSSPMTTSVSAHWARVMRVPLTRPAMCRAGGFSISTTFGRRGLQSATSCRLMLRTRSRVVCAATARCSVGEASRRCCALGGRAVRATWTVGASWRVKPRGHGLPVAGIRLTIPPIGAGNFTA